MDKEIKLVAVGDNCMDVYDRTGEAYPGGNPVNVAVYTLRLGGKASYTGVVGTDQYGSLMRAAVASKGVDVSHLKTAPGHRRLPCGDRKRQSGLWRLRRGRHGRVPPHPGGA